MSAARTSFRDRPAPPHTRQCPTVSSPDLRGGESAAGDRLAGKEGPISDPEPRPRVGRPKAYCLCDNRETARRLQLQLLQLPKPAGSRGHLELGPCSGRNRGRAQKCGPGTCLRHNGLTVGRSSIKRSLRRELQGRFPRQVDRKCTRRSVCSAWRESETQRDEILFFAGAARSSVASTPLLSHQGAEDAYGQPQPPASTHVSPARPLLSGPRGRGPTGFGPSCAAAAAP